MAKYATFTVPDAKRIAAATRRVEGSPRTYLHVPQRVPMGGGGGGTPVAPILGGGGPFTIAEYDATTGDIVGTMYRGKRRSSSVTALSDFHILYGSDGYLYSLGDGATLYNRDSGIVTKWNKDSFEKVWDSNRNGLTTVTPGSPTGAIGDDSFGPSLIEADDGYFWCRDGVNVNRINSSGVQQSNYVAGTGGEVILPTGENGAVIVVNDTTNYATGNALVRLNSSGTLTHSVAYTGAGTSAAAEAKVSGSYLIHLNRGITVATVRNVADLTSVTSHTPGGSIYGLATDGTQVFMGKTNYESRDITNLATTLWTGDANPIASSANYMLYQRGKLYHLTTSGRVVRINPSSGAIIFNVTSGVLPLQHANLAAVGSDFLMNAQTAATGNNIVCVNESDGSIRWRDYWASVRGIIVSDDDRIWVCGLRSDQ